MRVTPSALRADIYNLIDQVIRTGEPLEIERRSVILRLEPPRSRTWLDALPRPAASVVVGDPEDLVHVEWSDTWSGEGP